MPLAETEMCPASISAADNSTFDIDFFILIILKVLSYVSAAALH